MGYKDKLQPIAQDGSEKPSTGYLSKLQPAAQPKKKGLLDSVLEFGTNVSDFAGGRGLANEIGYQINRATLPESQKKFLEVPDRKETLGSALQVGSLLIPGAGAVRGAELGLKGIGLGTKLAKVGANVGVGAGSGALFDQGARLQGEDTGNAGTIVGAGLGALGGVGSIAKPIIKDAFAASRQKKITDSIGRVLQGDAKDIETGRKVISDLDVLGVKSYKDAADRVNEKVGLVSSKLDEALGTNKATRVLDNLHLSSTVGGQTLKQNYVKDALDQLEGFYSKVNNQPGIAQIRQLRSKAEQAGLNSQELNNLAKLHGRDLNAFNANGELASGLSKQAAENTRTGVKATMRDLFGNNISKAADSELTKLIRVRDLFKDMSESVNTLKQKTQNRSLGYRAGRLLEQASNILTLGTARGFIHAMFPSNVGLKTLNALDLERQLGKNLKLIKQAADPKASEESIIKALEQFIRNSGEKIPLMLPAPGQTTRIAPTLFASPRGPISPVLQEAVDVSRKLKVPTSRRYPKPRDFPEPYLRSDELPTIR